tara:strand:- start:318 stop:605 length:288 start_codon:yes stop_codon:yes gene_type:complete
VFPEIIVPPTEKTTSSVTSVPKFVTAENVTVLPDSMDEKSELIKIVSKTGSLLDDSPLVLSSLLQEFKKTAVMESMEIMCNEKYLTKDIIFQKLM